jgi:hypothetical protein
MTITFCDISLMICRVYLRAPEKCSTLLTLRKSFSNAKFLGLELETMSTVKTPSSAKDDSRHLDRYTGTPLVHHCQCHEFMWRDALLYSFPSPVHPLACYPPLKSLESVQKNAQRGILLSTHSLTGSKLAIRRAAFSPCFKSKSRNSMSRNAAMRG